MTNILTKLAALTELPGNGLLPCVHCLVSTCSVYENDYGRWLVGCGSCGSHTGTCKTKENAVKLHDSRPREQALIALVQEAAGEIERLTAALRKIEMMDEGASSAYLGDIAREALNSRKTANG